jgi:hypothetical protein
MSGGHARVELAKFDARDTSEGLAVIYEEASQLMASLHSKLAQHNGLRQFGVEFAGRVPPLEQRMHVPIIEEAIEDVFGRINMLSRRVQLMDVPASSSSEQLKGNVRDYLAKAHDEAKTAFEEQRKHLRELAAASPLASPILFPKLNERLSQAMAMKSPGLSSCSSPPLPSTAAPSAPNSSESATRAPTLFDFQLSDAMSEEGDVDDFSLDGLSSDEGDKSEAPRTPFAGVFS